VLAQCHVRRARFELGSGRPAAALAALADVAADDDQHTIGRPLQVSVEYLRARALDATRDPRAAQHLARAQAMIADLQQAMPPGYRDQFVAKREIREILGVLPRAASAPVP
jgi:hypothetical protein